MDLSIRKPNRIEIIRIVAVYALFGALWIYLSDTVLGWMIRDPEVMTRISVYKGLVFILLTAALLYFLIARYIQRISGHIAERNLAQQELARQKSMLDSIIEGTSDAVYIKDTAGRYLLANSALSRFVGKPAAEIIGKDDTNVFPAGEARTVMAQDRWAMEQSTPQTFEEHLTTSDGERYFLATKGAVRDGAGTVVALFGIARDITGRKRAELERLDLERQLLHSQKLESLGVLAGGIAHDFNNLLAAILGNLDLTMLRLPPSSPVRDNIEQSMQACRRAADLTRQMLAYSGKGTFQLKPVDLGEIVRDNMDLFRTVIPRNVTLTVAADRNLPKILADPGQIQQVVMNLITNAAESIGTQPGMVTVSTGVDTCDADCISTSCLAEKPPPGEFVFVEVADNGCGMDRETCQRLFEPFFTTKFTGRGLGMAATQGIVRAHRGVLLLESELGRGTTFRVLFPAAAVADVRTGTQNAPPPADALSPLGNKRAVLVVDDDPDVRTLVSEYLRHLDFVPFEAADGEEALERFRMLGDEPVLVILDLTMPTMDGVATFRELQKIRPDVKVILSSGFSVNSIAGQFSAAKPAGFIQKPFQVEELLAKIAEVLA